MHYAFDHYYSENIRDERGHRIGAVVVLDNKRERDEYCDEKNAEPIPMKVARWHMLDDIRDCDPWRATELEATAGIEEIIAVWIMMEW